MQTKTVSIVVTIDIIIKIFGAIVFLYFSHQNKQKYFHISYYFQVKSKKKYIVLNLFIIVPIVTTIGTVLFYIIIIQKVLIFLRNSQ